MIYSRKCGENLTCKLDEEGVLEKRLNQGHVKRFS